MIKNGKRRRRPLSSISGVIAAVSATAAVVPSTSESSVLVSAWTPPPSISFKTTSSSSLFAKRNKNRRDADDMNSWYDDVDDDATPQDVFWEEMERQRMYNQAGDNIARDPVAMASSNVQQQQQMMNGGGGGFASAAMNGGSSMANDLPGITASSNLPGGGSATAGFAFPPPNPSLEEQKKADATLSNYELYKVADNWINEDLIQWHIDQGVYAIDDEETEDEAEETRRLVEQLEALSDGYGESDEYKQNQLSIQSTMEQDEEPWDLYARQMDPDQREDPERADVLEVQGPSKDSEFYFDWDEPLDEEEEAAEEASLWERLEGCQVQSVRLEKARNNPKAQEFFHRPVDEMDGMEQMWISAVDNAVFKSLRGNFRNYGVEFADNFGDFDDGCPEDSLNYSIEDLAAMKARKVYEVTGLPVIASRTSFEVEPVPPTEFTSALTAAEASTTTGPARKPSPALNNPKFTSGYKINDIAMHVERLSEALRPVSQPDRVTRFTSCLCYYDGELEIFEHGVCECDMHFCTSVRTYISMAQAIENMVQTLKFSLNLEFMKLMRRRVDDVLTGSYGKASLKLRDRVLKDGRVLPNDIIDVSSFMDSQIDVNLMDECAEELAKRFMQEKPTKILTVATTGLVVALPMAKYLQIPCVYARKERSVVMSNTFKTGYSSKTVGKNRELIVSKSHIHEDDRVLVVDDFLSSGASQEALLRIINEAGATAVGVGVLLEKVYDSGRQALSGFDIPVKSLCRVASVTDGSIQLVEEEGFDRL